jgi:hypothetical protein
MTGKRRGLMRKTVITGAMAVSLSCMVMQAVTEADPQRVTAVSPDRLTVAIIGDPQYGFPSGTDPQPALGNAILTVTTQVRPISELNSSGL